MAFMTNAFHRVADQVELDRLIVKRCYSHSIPCISLCVPKSVIGHVSEVYLSMPFWHPNLFAQSMSAYPNALSIR